MKGNRHALRYQFRLIQICYFPSSATGIITGVAKRVALVIIAGVVFGTVLFYVGLESLFPKY